MTNFTQKGMKYDQISTVVTVTVPYTPLPIKIARLYISLFQARQMRKVENLFIYWHMVLQFKTSRHLNMWRRIQTNDYVFHLQG